MKTYTFLLLAAVITFAGCSSQERANQPQNAQNTAAAQPKAEETQPTRSPTDTLKALNEASKAKDVAAIKSLLSSGTIALTEQLAQEEKKSADELLRDDPPFAKLPELRNEKITGDTATVEVKNDVSGDYETFPFVKENGEWKVALDVYLKEFEQDLAEEMKEPPADEKGADAANGQSAPKK